MLVTGVPVADGDDWVGIATAPLPLDQAPAWAVVPRCGAVVVFAGTVRDHADGRAGVSLLEYEAYEEHAVARLRAVAAEARRRWPELGRVALLHRVGALAVTEVAVLVVVSAPHRAEAFDAGRWCIDTVKATVPLWKRETWTVGSGWGTRAAAVTEVGQ